MLKKLKKNPTFNEYFPEMVTDASGALMFNYVFNSNLQNKIYNLFGIELYDTDGQESLAGSFEMDFRILYGECQVDNTIINNPFTKFYPINDRYYYLQSILLR